jgi:hypothetical protein
MPRILLSACPQGLEGQEPARHVSRQRRLSVTSLKRCAEVVDAPGEGRDRRACP